MSIVKRIPKSLSFLFWMTLVTGLGYPLAVAGIARLVFPARAGGSLILVRGEVRGSRLLAQDFPSGRFFKPRPSATGYVYLGSGASNLAPTSSALGAAVKDRGEAWERAYGSTAPQDMLHSSGSGLDPDISLEAALDQVDSVSTARAFSAAQTQALRERIKKEVAGGTSAISPPRLNVVELNHLLETDPFYASPSQEGGIRQ